MARIGPRSTETIGGSNDGAHGNPEDNVIDPRTFVLREEPGSTSEGPDSGSGTDEGTGTERKKRGRPFGSTNKQKDKTLSVDAIQFSLTGIHALLATALQAPELVLSPAEAEHVARSYTAVARHFDMQASQKAIDIGNFCVTLGIVYGSRLVSIGIRRKATREARGKGTPAVVVQPAPRTTPTAPGSNAPAGDPNRPNGAQPLSRPKTPEDNTMLDEIPIPMFNAH
jgi:hypothetical protein